MRVWVGLLLGALALAGEGWVARNERLDALATRPAAEAVPALAELLGHKDSWLRRRAAQTLSLFQDAAAPAIAPLIQALYDPDPVVRGEAWAALHRIGEAASEAAPYLAEIPRELRPLHRPDRFEIVERPETGLDHRTRNRAFDLLTKGDGGERVRAAWTLGSLRRHSPALESALRDALVEEDWRLVGRAAEALGRIGVRDPGTARALAAALEGSSRFVRRKTVEAIAVAGAAALSQVEDLLGDPELSGLTLEALARARFLDGFVPLLQPLIADDHPRETRRAALLVLQRAGPSAAPLVERLTELARGPEASLAISVLSRVGPAAAPAIPLLAERARTGHRIAIAALGAIGEAAHPVLVELAGDSRALVRAKAYAALGAARKPTPAVLAVLDRGLEDPDSHARQTAARVLDAMPTRDDRGVPALVAELRGPIRVHEVQGIAHKLKLKARKETLLGLLEDEAWPVRYAALLALRGELAAEQLPVLERLAKDERKYVRVVAEAERQRLGRPVPADIPGLVAKLEDAAERNAAIAALSRLGASAAPAIPALARIVRSGDERSADEAARTLGTIGTAALPALVELAADSDERVRGRATAALMKLGRRALPYLRTRRDDPDRHVRLRVLFVLRRYGRTEELTGFLRDEDEQIRGAAITALVNMSHPRSVPGLLVALESEDGNVRMRALGGLSRFAQFGEELSPRVGALLEHPDEQTAAAAASTLARLGPHGQARLGKALRSTDGGVRVAAVAGLRYWGDAELLAGILKDPAESVRAALMEALRYRVEGVPTLVAGLSDEAVSVRRAAASALSRLGHRAGAAAPALVRALDDEEVSSGARSALRRIGPAALRAALDVAEEDRKQVLERVFRDYGSSAVPTLLIELRSGRRARQRAVLWALQAIGREADDALPALEGLVDDRDLGDEVRAAIERIRR